MNDLVEIKNADTTVHRVPGFGQAEPGQTLAVPTEVAEELLASPSKADASRPAWQRVQQLDTPKPPRAVIPAAGSEEDEHDPGQ